MKAKAYTAAGVERGDSVSLPANLFDGIVNESVLHQVVTALLAHRRQGTHSTKTPQTIRGGGSKPWRQKGTGRARAGTNRSPLWRGGSVTFGPQPRDYSPQIPRQLKRLAISSALNARAADGAVIAVEPLAMDAPRTRSIVDFVKAVEADGNVILLTDGLKRDVYLSARNVPGVLVRPWGEASAYDILWADLVVVEETALVNGDSTGEGQA
ncbi:MAG: 50S ribosomal protein L4 [Gemmatimonadales bacterium]|nr:MAG: 50S ribosomal protein L4 [Gemmatimonadales bacterium]